LIFSTKSFSEEIVNLSNDTSSGHKKLL